MLTKELVLASMTELPEKFSLDDLFERLILIQKIEIGLEQIKNGDGVPHEQVLKMIESWRKK